MQYIIGNRPEQDIADLPPSAPTSQYQQLEILLVGDLWNQAPGRTKFNPQFDFETGVA